MPQAILDKTSNLSQICDYFGKCQFENTKHLVLEIYWVQVERYVANEHRERTLFIHRCEKRSKKDTNKHSHCMIKVINIFMFIYRSKLLRLYQLM